MDPLEEKNSDAPRRSRFEELQKELEKCVLLDGDETFSLMRKKPDPNSPAYTPNPENVNMIANYFLVQMKDNFQLYQYVVSFSPEVDRVGKRKDLFKCLKNEVENFAYIFDGSTLISSALLVQESGEARIYEVLDEKENKEYTITVNLLKKANRNDAVYTQVYNLILRRCMFGLGLDEIGRQFYDRNNPINIPNYKVQLWPGYETSMRQYDSDVLICVEVIHRVLRLENILNILNGMKKLRNYKETAMVDLKNSIIMTQYNKKTYKVDDIDWTANPTCSFDMKGKSVTYIDYYKNTYDQEITDLTQPLLTCRPTKKDFRRKDDTNVIKLVPELCQVTGLSDAMRGDMNLMKALSTHLHMSPENRAQEALNFVIRFITNEKVRGYFGEWQMEIVPELVRCPYNMLKKEYIVFGDGELATTSQVDWTQAFRNRKMLKNEELKKWIVIAPTKDREGVQNLVRTTVKVAAALNFKIHPPRIVEIEDTKVASYMNALRSISLPMELVFFVIPVKSAEPYGTIKRYLTVDLGVPSQGFTSKNLYSRGIMSVVTKVVVQINAKLGGEPWGIRVPLKDVMIVGIDIQKTGGNFVGAFVATNSPNLRGYYNNVYYFPSDAADFSAGVVAGVKDAIDNYLERNGVCPERIIVFRDSGSEGQESRMDKEAKALMSAFTDFYEERKANKPPKFAYVAYCRKSGTRLFAQNTTNNNLTNPEPGTVVQDKITTTDYPTFYLVSPTVRQGCVTPCCYKVIVDTTRLTADKMQVLAYKLCHLYYNWSGTVGSPSAGHYARKLGFVAANVLKGGVPNKALNNSLHFL